MHRAALVAAIRDGLDGRQLVWFGIRGDDIEALTDLPELAAAFSVVNAYSRRSSIDGMAFEELTGCRVDLDAHDIDEELGSEVITDLRRTMLRTLSRPSALFTYRPSILVSAVCFARRDRCRYLGMFKDHQAAFEHKPWVESCIADLGISHVPWTYVADEDQIETLRFFDDGPVMLRRSRTSGGTGLTRVDDPESLAAAWPQQEEAYVSVAPFISDGMPINVGGVVWRDGVTLHPASVQLIGIPELTTRLFGYCGSDFSAVADLEPAVLDEIEAVTRQVGHWLLAHGYRGAFGVDFLVVGSVPLFIEVNPRFQGSTLVSSQIAVEAGESCVLLDHIGSFMDLPAPPSKPLHDWAMEGRPLSHFVVHWTGTERALVDSRGLRSALTAHPEAVRTDVIAPDGVWHDPGATVLRAIVGGSVTKSGFDFAEEWRSIVRHWRYETLAPAGGDRTST